MVLGPPTTAGIEKYEDALGTCIPQLQGKVLLGELLLQNKQVSIGSLPDAFPHLDFGWTFFFLELSKKLA